VRERLLLSGTLPVIPARSTRREPVHHDAHAYRDRNRIERFFGRIKHFRRIATRYDKTARSFLAFLSLAALKCWVPTFVNRT